MPHTTPMNDTPKNYLMGEKLTAPCPLDPGTRVRLVEMPDDVNPIEVGDTGTVQGGSGLQIWVAWDSGRTLALIPGFDTWEVIPQPTDEPHSESPDADVESETAKGVSDRGRSDQSP